MNARLLFFTLAALPSLFAEGPPAGTEPPAESDIVREAIEKFKASRQPADQDANDSKDANTPNPDPQATPPTPPPADAEPPAPPTEPPSPTESGTPAAPPATADPETPDTPPAPEPPAAAEPETPEAPPTSEPPQPGPSVKVEKLRVGQGLVDPKAVTLRAPFPAKPLATLPAGWHLEAPATAPPFIRDVELAAGSNITLNIRPHLLVPDADGAAAFSIVEPGFDPALGYRQAQTVGAVLADSLRQLEADSKQLGDAIDQLQQLLSALPKPEPQPGPNPGQPTTPNPKP